MGIALIGRAQPVRIVVVGGGYAGLRAALRLSTYIGPESEFSLTLIDRSDSHLLASELHEVVSARVACLEIRLPLQHLLRKRPVQFLQGEVKALDLEKKVVHLSAAEIPFDRLVLAVGSVPDFRGDGGEEVAGARLAYPFHDFYHACRLRMRVQKRFSDAAKETDKAVRRRMLTFVVAGGGATGVELAGELRRRLRWLARDLGMDGAESRLTLLEASDHLIPEFKRASARLVQKTLENDGVEVRLGSRVVAYDGANVRLESGEEIAAPTLVWTTGIRGDPLLAASGLRVDSEGRALVSPLMQAEGVENVYVVGDGACARDRRGRPVRPSMQAALQEGETAAWNIATEFAGQEKKECYPRRSTFLISCGGSKAVGWMGPLPVRGSLAWLLKEAVSARYLSSLGKSFLSRRLFRQKLEGYGHRHE